MVAPRVIKVAPTHGIAYWQNVVICDVQGELDAPGVRGISDAYCELAEKFPDGIAGITVLRASLSVGDTDTNAEAKRAMEVLRTKIKHVAVVIESGGFLAQLLRTIIRTLNAVARSSRLSIAANLDGAARAIAPHVITAGANSDAQIRRDLLAAIATVRRALPEPASN